MSSSKIELPHIRRFRRAVATLNQLMNDIRKYCPEANYYLADDELHLMGGPSHDHRALPLQDNSEDSVRLRTSGGGDW